MQSSEIINKQTNFLVLQAHGHKKESEDEVNATDNVLEVDLYQLQVNTFRRYKKHFKIPTPPGLNMAQLADVSLILIIGDF